MRLFSKLLNKWKMEWLEKSHTKLEEEFSLELSNRRKSLKEHLERQLNLTTLEFDAQQKTVQLKLEKLKNESLIEKESLARQLREELALLNQEDADVKSLRKRLAEENTQINLKISELNVSSEKEIANILHNWEIRKSSLTERIEIENNYLEKKQLDIDARRADLDRIKQSTDSRIALIRQEESTLRSDWESKRTALLQTIKTEFNKLTQEKEDNEFLEQRIQEKRRELDKVKEDLDHKIKLIEAKASPNAVWIEAFNSGFNKAWESMQPIMLEGVQRSRKAIEDTAINETLGRINGNYKKIN